MNTSRVRWWIILTGVEVSTIEGEKSTILELKVAEEDIGKVIGKHGRIAKAVRTILSSSSNRAGKTIRAGDSRLIRIAAKK